LIETLADIEALMLRCHFEQSRQYITEAVQCYRAGAFRAAIVSTWIAVVFDLIDKVRELAVSGDAAAAALETKYQTYITQIEQNNPIGVKSALEFEREILETCRVTLQFFDPQQFTDLQRLREDRHRCAHPSFQRAGIPYYPSAEQARLHIRNAVVHVLAEPPVQGRAALAQLKTLVSSAYFPTDDRAAITHLQSSGLMNGTDALVRGFIDLLVFGYLTDTDPLFYRRQVIAAINAAYELKPGIVEDRLRKQLNKALRDVPDNRFGGACCLVVFVTHAWGLLEQPSKDKVTNFITNGPTNEVLGGLQVLAQFAELEPAIRRRIDSLTLDELADAINTHGLRGPAKEKSLQYLSQASNWGRVNDVFDKTIIPLFSDLTAQDVERIIRMPNEAGADLIGAHNYRAFISNVRKAGLIPDVTLTPLLQQNGAGHLANV